MKSAQILESFSKRRETQEYPTSLKLTKVVSPILVIHRVT